MKYLIGESGGTKTDWVMVEDGKMIRSFVSERYHPSNWNSEFFERLLAFWSDKEWVKMCSVHLFVAGCYDRYKALELEEVFKRISERTQVLSDLHAAGLAHLGRSGKGKVGIMGTGSVVFDFENGQVIRLVGGKGHLIGDEGSAYYFGKLLLQRYSNGVLATDKQNKLNALFQQSGRPEESDKYQTAKLAELVAENDIEFEDVHEENINAFIRVHELGSGDQIYLTGTYAWYRKNQIERLFEQQGVQIAGVIARPIDRLIDLDWSLVM